MDVSGDGTLNLQWLFEGRVGDRASLGLLSYVPDSLIMEWCKQNPQIAPRLVPRFCTLYTNGEWTELGKFVLEEYGDDEAVLRAILAGFGPHSWIGSPVPYYENQILDLKKLEVHANPAVRVWATRTIEGIKDIITREREREEEFSIGIV